MAGKQPSICQSQCKGEAPQPEYPGRPPGWGVLGSGNAPVCLAVGFVEWILHLRIGVCYWPLFIGAVCSVWLLHRAGCCGGAYSKRRCRGGGLMLGVVFCLSSLFWNSRFIF